MKISLFMLLVSISALGSILPKKTKIIRFGTSFTESNSLWVGENLGDFTNDSKRTAVSSTLLYAIGLGKGWQMDLDIAYAKTKLRNGDMADAKKGDSESGLSNISFTAKKKIKNRNSRYSLVTEFGFAAPGSSNDFESEEMFLAITDGANKLFLGSHHNYRFSKMFALNLHLRYIHKIEARKPDQLTANLGLNINFKKFGLIPFVNYLHSFGGIDISTDPNSTFAQRGNQIGQGRLPFSQRDERILGFGVNSYFVLSSKWILDGFYQFTADGKNTDRATNVGFGVTKIF